MTKKEKLDKDPFLARETEKYETPIASREHILAVVTRFKKAVKRQTLVQHFGFEDPLRQEALRRRLKAMVRDGQLLKTPQGYGLLTETEIYQGILVVEREGEAHLRTMDGDSILLYGAMLKGYYDGDEIKVQVTQIDSKGSKRGRILALVKAVTPRIVGRLIETLDGFEILPFDRKFSQNLLVSKAHQHLAKDGDLVEIEILRGGKYELAASPVVKVLEVLGDFSTPGIEVNIALRKYKIPHRWDSGVLHECEKFGNSINLSRKEQRENLTDFNFVTIDGEDAKDFDDAVYCEPRKKGGWRLWVAIADVSYYVKPGSCLDKEAVLRGNSTYFPGSVVPMLPEVLSNGLCSLKPHVPRLCVVCQMTINSQGSVTRYQFYRGLMRSKARLTYTEVAEMLRGNETLKRHYETLFPSIEALHDLYLAFYQQRKERGAIDFDTVETRILFDKSGKIKNIVPQIRNVAHKMIEESMLAANECAAKFIHKHKYETLYRIHDKPSFDKLAALRQFLGELSLSLPGKKSPTPKDFSSLIARIQHREDKHMVETVLLRSLSQAQYSPQNIGHFGLAYATYLHFTSPIRRYPDLIVHRAIIDILTGKKQAKKHDLKTFENLGVHCSETERRSDEATRDAQLALKCYYMQDKVGEHFYGVVSGVANFGIFVELKDIYVEGLVHVTALGNEYFHYDAPSHRMIGERTRTTYQLGNHVEVKVARVDVEGKKIDLALVHQSKMSASGRKRRGQIKEEKNQLDEKRGKGPRKNRKKKWHKQK